MRLKFQKSCVVTSDAESRVGLCYELAFHETVHTSMGRPEATLVHGVIRDTHVLGKGAVICHAWVERDGIAWEPILQTELPIDIFIRLYDAEVIHRYPAKKALDLAMKSGHSGPWEEMPDHIQKTLVQINEERATS